MYFLTALYKKFKIVINKELIIVIFSILLNFGIVLGINYLGLHIASLSDKVQYFNYNLLNPLFIICGFSMFSMFSKYNFNSMMINKISSLSLIFYLFQENLIFRNRIRPIIYKCLLSFFNIEISYLLMCLICFFAVIILCFIYDFASTKFLHNIPEIINELYSKIYNKFFVKIYGHIDRKE